MKYRPSVFYAAYDENDSDIHHRKSESKTEKALHDQAKAEKSMAQQKIDEILNSSIGKTSENEQSNTNAWSTEQNSSGEKMGGQTPKEDYKSPVPNMANPASPSSYSHKEEGTYDQAGFGSSMMGHTPNETPNYGQNFNRETDGFNSQSKVPENQNEMAENYVPTGMQESQNGYESPEANNGSSFDGYSGGAFPDGSAGRSNPQEQNGNGFGGIDPTGGLGGGGSTGGIGGSYTGSSDSGFTGATNLLYQFTNGDVNLRGVNPEKGFGDNIAAALDEYARHPWKTSENCFYDNYQRVNKIAAVASFVTGGYYAAEKASAYDSLDKSEIKSGMDVYSRAGLGYAAENKMNSHLESCMFSIKDNDGNVVLKSGSELAFTGKQISDLANNGCIVYNDGVLTFNNQGDSRTFASNYAASMQESVRREEFLNPITVKDKAKALEMARHAMLGELRQDADFNSFMDMSQKPEHMSKVDFMSQQCFEKDQFLTGQIMNELGIQANLLNSVGYSDGFSAINSSENAQLDNFEDIVRKNCESAFSKLDTDISNMNGEMKQLMELKNGLRDKITDKTRELNDLTAGKIAPPSGMTREGYEKKLKDSIAELEKQSKHADTKMNALSSDLQKKQDVKDKLKKSEKTLTKRSEQRHTVRELNKTAKEDGNTGRMAYGARILGNKVIGQDMMLGLETYKRIYKVADMGVRAVHRASCGVEVKFLDKHKSLTENFKLVNRYEDQLKFSDKENKLFLEGKKSGKQLKDYHKEKISRVESRKMSIHNKVVAQNRENLERLENTRNLSPEQKKELETLRKKVAMDEKRSGKRVKRDTRKSKALEKKNARRKKREDRREKRLAAFANTRFGKFANGIRDKIAAFQKTKIGKLLNAFRNPFETLKQLLFAKIKVPLMGAAGSLLIFMLKMSMMATVIIIAVFFLSELFKPTHLTDDLDSGMDGLNYTQIIVNDSSSKLASSFKTVAERDAYTHYASMDKDALEAAYNAGDVAIKSDGYDWYRGINNGKIAGIYYNETRGSSNPTKAISVNDNLVPITSMMHFRFLDEISYLNWMNAKGYVFYMYAKSHYTGDYEAKAEDNCNTLYANLWSVTGTHNVGGTVVNNFSASKDVFGRWNYTIWRPTGEDVTCKNIYVHGYDKEAFAKARYDTFTASTSAGSAAMNAFYSSVTGTFEGLWAAWFNDNSYIKQGITEDDWNGVSAYNKPKDALGECKDAVAIGIDRLTETRKVSDVSGYNEAANLLAARTGIYGAEKCPQYEHEHRAVGCTDESCWNLVDGVWKTTKEVHVHRNEALSVHACDWSNCSNKDKLGNAQPFEHTHGSGCNNTYCGKEEHVHGSSCCSIEVHTHSYSCIKTTYGVCGNCGGILSPGAAGTAAHQCPNGGNGYEQYQYDSWSCGKSEHSHTNADGSRNPDCNNDACTNKDANGIPYEHTHGADCCSLNEHTHYSSCCIYEEHKHTPSICYWTSDSSVNPKGYTGCAHTRLDGTQEYGKVQHIHLAWRSAQNPGCYTTVWVCPGHCGGHMTPQVDVFQDMTYENLVYHDIYKIQKGKYLQDDDFKVNGTKLFSKDNDQGMSDSFVTVQAWKTFWDQRALVWFSPFHTTPMGDLKQLGRSIKYGAASVVDGISNLFHKLISSFTGMGLDVSSEESVTSDIAEMRDANILDEYGFTGWFKKDEAGNEITDASGNHIHDPKVLETVDSLYPAENNYVGAIENWSDIGDVRFSLGSVKPLTNDQIDLILSQITGTPEEKEIVKTALQAVGRYLYDEEEDVFTAANSGKTNNPKCISQIIKNVAGNDYTTRYMKTIQEWDSYASPGHGLRSGCVLVRKNERIFDPDDHENSAIGDVAIYIGRIFWNEKKEIPNESGVGQSYNMIVHCIPGKGCVIGELKIPAGEATAITRLETCDVTRFVTR